jgi:hypothetical protein
MAQSVVYPVGHSCSQAMQEGRLVWPTAVPFHCQQPAALLHWIGLADSKPYPILLSKPRELHFRAACGSRNRWCLPQSSMLR